MQSLKEFQNQSALALSDSTLDCPDAVSEQSTKGSSRRFNIYRNNRATSLIENLQATYPVVFQLLGEEYFNAVARMFIDDQPPRSPIMMEYGGEFADYLTRFPAIQSRAYVVDVARLEWSCQLAYHAFDAPVLNMTHLAMYQPEELLQLQLVPHPTVKIIESQWPIASIWLQSVDRETNIGIDMQSAQTVMIVRPLYDVQVHTIDTDIARFFSLLSDQKTLGQASECLLSTNESFDPGNALGALIAASAFEAPREHEPPVIHS